MEFEVSISCDRKTGEIYAVYFGVRKGEAVTTREFAEGAALADYDKQGRLLGVELLGPCNVKVLGQIARNEPAVRQFIRSSAPAKMLLSH